MEDIIFQLAYVLGFFIFCFLCSVVIMTIDAYVYALFGWSFLFALEKWLFKNE